MMVSKPSESKQKLFGRAPTPPASTEIEESRCHVTISADKKH